MEFNPSGRKGKQAKKIKIYSNVSDEPMILKIAAFIIEDPNRMKTKIGGLGLENKRVNLGQFSKIQVKQDTIRYRNVSENELEIAFGKLPEYIICEAIPANLKPKKSGYILISYNGEKAGRIGYKRDNIPVMVRTLNQQISSTIALESIIVDDFTHLSKIDLQFVPSCKFSKNIYSLGKISKNDSELVEIEYLNEGKRDLIIHQVEVPHEIELISYDETIAPGNKGIIKLKVTSGNANSYFRKKIEIYTNDPDTAIETISIMGSLN